jgi:hypothetical protein
VSQPGAVAALAATCDRIAEALPAVRVAAARPGIGAALAELADAGTSHNPDFLAATGGLVAIGSDLEAAAGHLSMAVGRVRAFRARLG